MKHLKNSALVASLISTLALTSSCELADNLLHGGCDDYAAQRLEDHEAAGTLMPEIPVVAENFAMALVLNNYAINDFFQRLADTDFPTFEAGINLPIVGRLGIAATPEIPLLQIGGDASCVDCISAEVPLNLGISLGRAETNAGRMVVAGQMPMGLYPDLDNPDRTVLAALFQDIDVTDVQVQTDPDVINGVAPGASGPVASAARELGSVAATAWLRTRFEDATIAAFDPWVLGEGQIKLAPRGPFVNPVQGSLVFAMQSNLPIYEGGGGYYTAAEQADLLPLPAGADMGVIIHPRLLLGLTRRMNYEGVVPTDLSDDGEPIPVEDGAEEEESLGAGDWIMLHDIAPNPDGLLDVIARVYRTESFCGYADIAAGMALSIQPEGITFTVGAPEVVEGAGFGVALGVASFAVESYMAAVGRTLEVTVGYDQVFGGETGDQAQIGAFEAGIDARGAYVYFNLNPNGNPDL